jgi:V/A-type H+-transporting ATPase subunit I
MILLTSIAINTVFKFKHKDYAEAICSPIGVSGLLFYGFVLAGIALMTIGINVFNIVTIILLIVIPILLIFLKEPLHRLFHHEKMFPDGIGGFLTEGFFELFEVLLSYVTNTLSFLRVGGFVLSHAGLMMVVKVLAGPTLDPVVMALGNLFVMALEGLIVGIQVLRLEFYEMFSRYYDGDGFAFNPIV